MRRADLTIVLATAAMILVAAYALACRSVGAGLYGF